MAITTAPINEPNATRTATYFGLKPGNSDSTDAMNDMIGAFNDEDIDAIVFPPGEFNFGGALDPITRVQGSIKGAGRQITRLVIPSDADSDTGTFFTLGTNSGAASRLIIEDMTLSDESTNGNGNTYAIKIDSGSYVQLNRLYLKEVCSGISLGAADGSDVADAIEMGFIFIDLKRGKGGAGVKVHGAGNIRANTVKVIAGNNIAAGGAADTDTHMRGLHYEIVGTADTAVWDACQFNFPDVNVDNVVIIDTHSSTEGMANICFRDCVMDHAVAGACLDIRGPLSTGILRRMDFINLRAISSGGRAVKISNDGSGEMYDISFIGGKLGGASAVDEIVYMPTSNAKRIRFMGTNILASGTNAKVGFRIGAVTDWMVVNCLGGDFIYDSNAVLTKFIETTGNADDFLVANNQAVVTDKFIEHFAYTNPESLDRIIQGNAGVSAPSPRTLHTGGIGATQSTDGTNTVPSITETYIAEILIPQQTLITGISVLHGSVVAGNIKLGLANQSGVVVASTASTAAAGAADSYQKIDLSAAYVASAGTYYVLLQCSDTTHRFNAHVLGTFGAGKKTGETYGTFTTITPLTTFAVNGPIASLY
jgi:hypothetical protein